MESWPQPLERVRAPNKAFQEPLFRLVLPSGENEMTLMRLRVLFHWTAPKLDVRFWGGEGNVLKPPPPQKKKNQVELFIFSAILGVEGAD